MKFIDSMIALAEPVIDSFECELVDAEYLKEGESRVLRFFIEKKVGTVGIEDLAEVSRAISELIDKDESIEQSFVLEVSSPGVERVLKTEKDYQRFSGSTVDVSLYEAVEGNKKYTAALKGYRDGVFTFALSDKEITIPREKVAKINLHFEF